VHNNKQVRLSPSPYIRMSLSFPQQDSIAVVTDPCALIWKAQGKLISFIQILSEWRQGEDGIDADILTTQSDL